MANHDQDMATGRGPAMGHGQHRHAGLVVIVPSRTAPAPRNAASTKKIPARTSAAISRLIPPVTAAQPIIGGMPPPHRR